MHITSLRFNIDHCNDLDLSSLSYFHFFAVDSFGGSSPLGQTSPSIGTSIPWSYEMLDQDQDKTKEEDQDQNEKWVLETLRAEAGRLLGSFLDQQLLREGLDPCWRERILNLANKICSLVSLELQGMWAMKQVYWLIG